MEYVQPIRDITKIDEMKIVLREQSERNYMLFLLGINTGLRISDILRIRVCDIKGKSILIIREKKNSKVAKLPIAGIKGEIEKYIRGMEDDEYLFTSQKGENTPITRVQAYRILNNAAREVGLQEIGTHTLRKTFGYHFYQQTKDIAMLQLIFNHTDQSTTLRYIGITEEMIENTLVKFRL